MEPIKIRPAREQVADALRRAIFTGEIQRGEELTQEAVAAQLGVSRMPVREAFLMLERDGLLMLNSHRKAVVRGLTEEDIVDHYDIRALLEGEAAARASVSEEVADIRAAYEDARSAGLRGDAAAFVEANQQFHRAVWEAADNPYLMRFLDQLWRGLPPHLPELVPVQMRQSLADHDQIMSALEAKDPEAARRAMRHHIQRSLQQFLNAWRSGSDS
ncbi:MAG: GntR family transcriptional regulator [Thermoflavifilum sp.]|nr:GntR family transcriptional regulator [Thermoflavifilum sp.]MCL6514248.1 GntR family transcriptional regulator [Alicyclobacillus sp.]